MAGQLVYRKKKTVFTDGLHHHFARLSGAVLYLSEPKGKHSKWVCDRGGFDLELWYDDADDGED